MKPYSDYQLKLHQKCPPPFQNGEVMFKIYLPGILAMSIIVVSSNILVQFLYGNWLTYGAFTYPLAFLVTDIMNRDDEHSTRGRQTWRARCQRVYGFVDLARLVFLSARFT